MGSFYMAARQYFTQVTSHFCKCLSSLSSISSSSFTSSLSPILYNDNIIQDSDGDFNEQECKIIIDSNNSAGSPDPVLVTLEEGSEVHLSKFIDKEKARIDGKWETSSSGSGAAFNHRRYPPKT